MDTYVGGTYHSKHRPSEETDATRKGSQVYSGNQIHYYDAEKRASTAGEKERTSTTRKHSKFPSLSRIGRSNTFSFGRKKEKESDSKMADRSNRIVEKNSSRCSQESKNKETKGSKIKSQDCSGYNDGSYNYDARQMYTQGKTKSHEDRYASHEPRKGSSRRGEVTRSRSYDVRCSVEGKENKSSSKDYSMSPSHGKHSSGKDRKNPRRKDCKRKEAPIDRGFDYDNIPLWLRNPPKILIQDFSSDYIDETTFDEEYFDLVQWAFRVLEQQCNYLIYPPFSDLAFEDDEPTLLGAVSNQPNEPLKMITNETARVGSTLDYILHPISTGAANVLQTGAKFANFTSRVFRGINFESLIKKRGEEEIGKKKE